MALIKKPQGGYRLLPIDHLCVAWCAYKSGRLSWLGFRVFLALQEVVARREAAKRSGGAKADGLWLSTVVPELQTLVRCARPSQVRSALASLERAGQVRTDGKGIDLNSQVEQNAQVSAMLGRIARRGTVPVPRRVLVHLAAGASTAVAAYMLGVVLRCCHLRGRGEFRSRGRCSARYVAELFGLHLRTVKRASAMVAGYGWVRKDRPDRWTRRYGPVVHVVVDWARSGIESPPVPAPACTDSPPQVTRRHTGSPPVNKKQELLSDLRNQEPQVVPKAASMRPCPKATTALGSLTVAELWDPNRLDRRFHVAVEAGLVDSGIAGRLRFFAAAQHALRVATRNPCGLFATVVRRRLWSFISQEDEDRARAMIQTVERPAARGQSPCTTNKRLDRLIAGVADRMGLPSRHDSTNSRTNPPMWSKKLARSRRVASSLWWQVEL